MIDRHGTNPQLADSSFDCLVCFWIALGFWIDKDRGAECTPKRVIYKVNCSIEEIINIISNEGSFPHDGTEGLSSKTRVISIFRI